MFEKPTSLDRADADRFDRSAVFSAVLEEMDQDAPQAAPLRPVEWSELTARLVAARDLRQVLRRDSQRTISDTAHDFADAAARYFRTKGEGQSIFNPVALEHRKGSPGNILEQMGLHDYDAKSPGLLTKGDARDD